MGYSVRCECDKSVAVTEAEFGKSAMCACGRRVVIPLAEEFGDGREILSAASIERRIRRLIAAGDLPGGNGCGGCGAGEAHNISVLVECERYTTHVSGGRRILILPLFFFRASGK